MLLVWVGGVAGCRECARTESTLGYDWQGLEIIAHRGASARAPENTLAAIELAWEHGSDAVEVDVHLSRDQKVMAIHDDSTRRTGGRTWRVAHTTSSRLRKLDVGRYKGPRYRGQVIPFLSDVLASLPTQGRLFIDVKCGAEIVRPLSDLLATSGKQDQVVLLSFDFDMLAQFKQIMPQVPVYGLCRSWPGKSYPPSLIERVQLAGLDGLDVHHAGLTPDFARQVQSADLALYVWTVDSPAVARRLADMQVNGITTNDPIRYRPWRQDLEDDETLYSYSQDNSGIEASIFLQAESVGL